MGKTVVMILIAAGVFYLLYSNGYMIINRKTALTYFGSRKGTSANFTSCSGYIKRIVRFKADQKSTFRLNAELTKGDVSVELLDSSKTRIMYLDRTSPSAEITVEKNRKYYLIINFQSASGRYSLIRE